MNMVEIVITQTSRIPLVETSNRQKRVVRIVDRGVTRVNEPNVSFVLKSAELILFILSKKLLNKSVRLGEFVHYKGYEDIENLKEV
jgi:hypothetical protein